MREELYISARSGKRRGKERKEFYRNPQKYAKRLFGEVWRLEVSKEELEEHLKATYCDERRGEPFELPGLVRPHEPEVSFDLSELRLWKVRRC